MKINLKLSMVSHPSHILIVGETQYVPNVGDYVDRKGLRKSRRWIIRADGSGIDVRLWLQDAPP